MRRSPWSNPLLSAQQTVYKDLTGQNTKPSYHNHSQLKISRAPFGDERFMNLNFVDNTVIFTETVEVLLASLDPSIC